MELLAKKVKLIRPKQEGYWHRLGIKLKKYLPIMAFIVPAAFMAVLFGYIPLIFLLAAFKTNFNLSIYTPFQALFSPNWSFVQFTKIFGENADEFFLALKNTLVINGIKLVLIFPIPIIIAIMLSEVKNATLAKLFLIILCLPNFLSWPTVIGIWQNFFRQSDGVINSIFGTNIGWLTSDNGPNGISLFRFFVISFDAWKGCGWNSIMFYTAIVSIDKSYYEAAELDGANKFQQTLRLTLPSIFPTIALMFIMNITYILSCGFDEINLLANLDPNWKLYETTLDYYLYNQALAENADFSYATALGLFNSTVSLTFMLVGNSFCKKFLHRGLW
ncbi:MAG: ABC transporter permease subunit [Bacilli bacterium]|nr:ABC transporter permease subunit [Bacilli bacterium]